VARVHKVSKHLQPVACEAQTILPTPGAAAPAATGRKGKNFDKVNPRVVVELERAFGVGRSTRNAVPEPAVLKFLTTEVSLAKRLLFRTNVWTAPPTPSHSRARAYVLISRPQHAQCDTAAPGSGTPGALAAEVLPGPHLDTDRVEALVNTLKDSAFGESHLMWVRMQERYGKVRATHSSSSASSEHARC
jgi:hypothetical protein